MAGLDAYTKLLLHFNGANTETFGVLDTEGATVTRSGAFCSCYNPVYSSTTLFKGIMKFDGSDDYLSVPHDAPSQTFFADYGNPSTAYTIDFWIYGTSTGGIFWKSDGTSDGAGYQCYYDATSELVYWQAVWGNSTSGLVNMGGGATKETWHHVALVKGTDGVWNMYIDGSVACAPQTPTKATVALTSPFYIGSHHPWAGFDVGNFGGYIDEFRISDVARTISSTPTQPYTSDANTCMLLHFDGIGDSTSGEDPLSAANGGYISTAQNKFGDSSLLLNGSSDIELTDSADFALGTEWTVDFWIYLNALPAIALPNYAYTHIVGQSSGTYVNWTIGYMGGADGGDLRRLGFWLNGIAYLFYIHTPEVGAWHHVAVAGTSGYVRMFYDGTYVAGDANTRAIPDINYVVELGYATTGVSSHNTNNYLNAYIDELRFSNYCRWTTDFTPGAGEYTVDSAIDVIGISDSVSGSNVTPLLAGGVYDTILVGDNAGSTASDGIAITDNIAGVLNSIGCGIIDTLVLYGDDESMVFPLYLSALDNIAVSEDVSPLLPIILTSLDDSVTAADNAGGRVYPLLQLSYDGVTASDSDYESLDRDFSPPTLVLNTRTNIGVQNINKAVTRYSETGGGCPKCGSSEYQ